MRKRASTLFSQEFVAGNIGSNLWNYSNTTNTVEPTPLANFGEMIHGFIRYEIADHLGNVRSTITDRKLPSQNAGNTE